MQGDPAEQYQKEQAEGMEMGGLSQCRKEQLNVSVDFRRELWYWLCSQKMKGGDQDEKTENGTSNPL